MARHGRTGLNACLAITGRRNDHLRHELVAEFPLYASEPVITRREYDHEIELGQGNRRAAGDARRRSVRSILKYNLTTTNRANKLLNYSC